MPHRNFIGRGGNRNPRGSRQREERHDLAFARQVLRLRVYPEDQDPRSGAAAIHHDVEVVARAAKKLAVDRPLTWEGVGLEFFIEYMTARGAAIEHHALAI